MQTLANVEAARLVDTTSGKAGELSNVG
jgi:hypothetical protein